MNKLVSLAQIKHYKSIVLSKQTHTTLAKTLSLFKANPDFDKLTYNHHFNTTNFSFMIEQMSRIGWIADEIDHHP